MFGLAMLIGQQNADEVVETMKKEADLPPNPNKAFFVQLDLEQERKAIAPISREEAR